MDQLTYRPVTEAIESYKRNDQLLREILGDQYCEDSISYMDLEEYRGWKTRKELRLGARGANLVSAATDIVKGIDSAYKENPTLASTLIPEVAISVLGISEDMTDEDKTFARAAISMATRRVYGELI